MVDLVTAVGGIPNWPPRAPIHSWEDTTSPRISMPDGTEPARHPPPEVVLASARRDGAVRPPWTPRNRPRAARAGALTRSAAAYQAGARSLQPTVGTRPGGSISRGGSAPQ